MLLSEHQSKSQGADQLLNYAHIDDGVIHMKDGAFLCAYRYIGPELDSASLAQLNGLVENFNKAMLNFYDGWMITTDTIRVPANDYPEMAYFPCAAAALVDDERRMQFATEGEHFESIQIINFVWKYPVKKYNWFTSLFNRSMFITNLEDHEKYIGIPEFLEKYHATVNRCVNVLSNYMNFQRLDSVDLLSYIHFCITGTFKVRQVPPPDMFLDVYMSSETILGGFEPKIGKKHVKVLGLMGVKFDESYNGILECLGTYPLVYRVCNRFIALSIPTAEKELKKFRKFWNNQVTGLVGLATEALLNKPSKNIDESALDMKDEAKSAIAQNKSGTTRFGYWTCDVIFMSDDMNVLNIAIEDFTNVLDKLQFEHIDEDNNAMDAFLGTIPGHGSCNIRRVFVNSKQLAHFIPLGSVWAGDERVSSSSLLPKNAPVCFMAKTTGSTPFRFNVDHHDIGHGATLGPTGAGKTTFEQFKMTQFFRYPNAHGFIFDKDLSQYGWTYAMGGKHYNIGDDNSIGFAPLLNLETKSDINLACQYVEMLCELQGLTIDPKTRNRIVEAVHTLASTDKSQDRSISRLYSLAHESIQPALKFYTVDGQFSMLDSLTDTIQNGHLHCFEMGWLIKQDVKYYLPVLMHVFNHIYRFLTEAAGTKPTFIYLEEAWQYISHPVFSAYIIDWAKTFRKLNARLWLATQSLADLYDPETGKLRSSTAAILEACSTRVYLPNDKMDKSIENLYEQIGLTERQIEIIKNAEPKRDYYVVRPPLEDSPNQFSGNRLFELGWSGLDKKPLALSFIGLNPSKSKKLAQLIQEFPKEEDWLPQWLEMEGQTEWLEHYYNNYSTENQNA
jgi:type IV secretion system protein VirB4